MLKRLLQFVLIIVSTSIARAQGEPLTRGQSITSIPGNADTRDITPGPKDIGGIEGPYGSWLVIGIGCGILYDDNYSSTNISRHPDFHYSVNPIIDWQQNRNRLTFALQYSPGLNISQHLHNRDVLAQAAGLKLKYKLFRHLSLGLHDDFRVTSDPFEITNIPASTPRPLIGSTQILITPLARRTTMLGGLDATYQLNPWSSVSLSGGFSQTHFGNARGSNSPINQLINSRSVNGRTFYIRRISRRHSIGGEYDFLDLRFKRGHDARTLTHSFFYFHQVLLTPKMTLAVYGGPEFTRTQDQLALNFLGLVIDIPVAKRGVSGAGGLVFDYKGDRTSARLSASRRVGEGGGLLGSVTASTVALNLSRNLTSLWTGSLDASADDARILNVVGSRARIANLSSGVSFSGKLSEDFSLLLSYSHVHQKHGGVLFGVAADHNRASISLDYHFTHTLGR